MKTTSMSKALVFGALLAAAAAALPACSASPQGDGDENVEEAVDQQTAGYVFHCRPADRVTGTEIATIRISPTRASFTAVDVNLSGAAATYTYNPKYHPRAAAHQGQLQYVWTDPGMHKMVLLLDPTMRSGGTALPDGGHGGEVIVEGPRISHAIKSMVCRR